MKHKINNAGDDRRAKTAMLFEKIVVNVGVGRASQISNFEEKIFPQILRDIAAVTGQVPEARKAKKSIAGFKLREGQTVGARVTLRRKRMIDFFERLITIVLPRVRDFTGLDERIVDNGGVLNIGLREQTVFPEIHPEKSPFLFSLEISVVPRAKRREKMIEAYRHMGVPFKKKK